MCEQNLFNTPVSDIWENLKYLKQFFKYGTVEPRLSGLTEPKGKPVNPDIWVIKTKQILK